MWGQRMCEDKLITVDGGSALCIWTIYIWFLDVEGDFVVLVYL